MGNPVLVKMIETFSSEEVGLGFAMVQICMVKLIPFVRSQMNHAKPFFKKKKNLNEGNLSKEHFGLVFSW